MIKQIVKALALILVVTMVLVAGKNILLGSNSNSLTAKATETISLASSLSNDGYQEVVLKMENYEYLTVPAVLEKDVPVRMTVDLDTVYGCMRDVVINEFNVRKYVSEGDNIIEFTPDKSGTFWIVCSMNMGRGQFSVAVDSSSSSVDDYEEPAPATASGSCGDDDCSGSKNGGCDGSCGGASGTSSGTCGV